MKSGQIFLGISMGEREREKLIKKPTMIATDMDKHFNFIFFSGETDIIDTFILSPSLSIQLDTCSFFVCLLTSFGNSGRYISLSCKHRQFLDYFSTASRKQWQHKQEGRMNKILMFPRQQFGSNSNRTSP